MSYIYIAFLVISVSYVNFCRAKLCTITLLFYFLAFFIIFCPILIIISFISSTFFLFSKKCPKQLCIFCYIFQVSCTYHQARSKKRHRKSVPLHLYPDSTKSHKNLLTFYYSTVTPSVSCALVQAAFQSLMISSKDLSPLAACSINS